MNVVYCSEMMKSVMHVSMYVPPICVFFVKNWNFEKLITDGVDMTISIDRYYHTSVFCMI